MGGHCSFGCYIYLTCKANGCLIELCFQVSLLWSSGDRLFVFTMLPYFNETQGTFFCSHLLLTRLKWRESIYWYTISYWGVAWIPSTDEKRINGYGGVYNIFSAVRYTKEVCRVENRKKHCIFLSQNSVPVDTHILCGADYWIEDTFNLTKKTTSSQTFR